MYIRVLVTVTIIYCLNIVTISIAHAISADALQCYNDHKALSVEQIDTLGNIQFCYGQVFSSAQVDGIVSYFSFRTPVTNPKLKVYKKTYRCYFFGPLEPITSIRGTGYETYGRLFRTITHKLTPFGQSLVPGIDEFSIKQGAIPSRFQRLHPECAIGGLGVGKHEIDELLQSQGSASFASRDEIICFNWRFECNVPGETKKAYFEDVVPFGVLRKGQSHGYWALLYLYKKYQAQNKF